MLDNSLEVNAKASTDRYTKRFIDPPNNETVSGITAVSTGSHGGTPALPPPPELSPSAPPSSLPPSLAPTGTPVPGQPTIIMGDLAAIDNQFPNIPGPMAESVSRDPSLRSRLTPSSLNVSLAEGARSEEQQRLINLFRNGETTVNPGQQGTRLGIPQPNHHPQTPAPMPAGENIPPLSNHPITNIAATLGKWIFNKMKS